MSVDQQTLNEAITVLLRRGGDGPDSVSHRGHVLKSLAALCFEAGYEAAVNKLNRTHTLHGRRVFGRYATEAELDRLPSKWKDCAAQLTSSKYQAMRAVGIVPQDVPS